MDPTPEELERADFSTTDSGYDPESVRVLLRRAADRIRALERDGVKSVSASVTAVLEQAVRSGEDLVAEATRDAEAIRNAARADAERITTDAAEVAARAVADGEHRAAERLEEAEAEVADIVATAEQDARERAKIVISEAQQRLDRLLAAERDVHDRIQAALGDLHTALARVGIEQDAELALTVEDPGLTEPEAGLHWADTADAPTEPVADEVDPDRAVDPHADRRSA